LPIACASTETKSDEKTPAGKFRAVGPREPVKVAPWTQGAVEVFFENMPTSLRFNMPAYPAMMMENGIQYVTFGAETYDPRVGRKSFEVQQDLDNTYNRFWIESENDARIVVRFRGALKGDGVDEIAHTDIPSGSPYGKGDWVDEWYYIYPDGTHTRHMRIYTGLAQLGKPFGYNRRPPSVIYEFMEAAVWNVPGHVPTDDVETEALTLVKLVGDYTENMFEKGQSKTISFLPYPKDFGDFRDSHIMIINLKSQYKPFVIGSPFGARAQPYVVSWKISPERVFVAWDMREEEPPRNHFITELGHILHYGYYRKTENTLEQVYLLGMTNAKDTVGHVVPLAWSWIAPPRLEIEDREPSYDLIYNTAQRAYIVPRKGQGPVALEFKLNKYSYEAPLHIVNPSFVVKDWGKAGVNLEIDDKPLKQGMNFRVGYEKTDKGTDLVVWLKVESTESISISIAPVDD
jgi:hypothetical protein